MKLEHLLAEVKRRETQKEREWFESLKEALDKGEIELAKESVQGAIEMLKRKEVTG